MGYLSPEYAIYGQVSTKLDVFSFGVLILEIVSGRKNIDHRLPSSEQCLVQWAQSLHSNHQMLELVDNSLQKASSAEQETLKRVVEVGLLCLHHLPTRRPTMSNVVAMLIGNKEIHPFSLGEYHGTFPQRGGFASSSLPSAESWFLSSVPKEICGDRDVEMHGTPPLLMESRSLSKPTASPS